MCIPGSIGLIYYVIVRHSIHSTLLGLLINNFSYNFSSEHYINFYSLSMILTIQPLSLRLNNFLRVGSNA